MQNLTKDVFSDKTDQLADRLGVTLKELTDVLGISTDSLFGYRTGRLPISAKAWRKLRNAEAKAGLISDPNLTPPPAPKFSGNSPSRIGNNPDSSVKLNPAFAPPVGNPTQQDCIDHLTAYLAEAKHVPGLVAHTLIELKKHFKVAEARAQRDDL